ncbi:Pentatricopeptide repeat-containing protein [Ananas comosus]|uniref:Pentatricopeptide repeat-containing protein n=1 Tax=Ananas comosus TaxID=4615 RepID=A0A199VQM4_ANACO|nr:Pentatricopeptide repeat-containing protein [Ananas comosus]
MYARCGRPGDARRVFDEIPRRDLVSWNAMISGYAKAGCAAEAVALFAAMAEEGWEPNGVTLVGVLAACGDLGNSSLGRRLEEEYAGRGARGSDPFVGSALIDMYGKCGDLAAARRVFDEIPAKDTNGMSNEAIALFLSMAEANIKPDKITLVGVLSACAAVGAIELGIKLDEYALQNGLYHNVYVGTALVDMFAKCGNLDRAIHVFHNMTQKNVVSYNAMISALALHGRSCEAILLFKQMRNEEGIFPDDISLIGVLSACVHAGLVDEGRRWFNSMVSEFGLAPKAEHYSCMVDLLARAGHLEEAWDFIEKMPEKADAVVLGALLNACRKCKNVEIGERVMERILQVEPSNSWNYLVSSKIYASSNRWDDSARMIELMRERGVSKTPGCSWVEIDGEVHEFYAGDDLHLCTEDIYQTLIALVEEMKLEGYIPNIYLS